MMTQIKYALAFMFGFLYSGCIWKLASRPDLQTDTLGILCLWGVVLGGIAIVICVGYFFLSNWEKE